MAGESQPFFHLAPHALLVRGAKNAALYDLEQGGIYGLSGASRSLIEDISVGKPVASTERAFPNARRFLAKLETLGLGSFSIDPEGPLPVAIAPERPMLRQLWLALNSNCNLRCQHCYATSEPGPFDGRVPTWRVLEVLDEARSVFDLACVQLIGGEPLLLGKERVATILRHACALGIPTIEVFTNAHLIDDFYLELFRETGTSVAISIYSDGPNEHDAVTAHPGSWARTVAAARRVRDAAIPLRFGVTAMSANAGSVGRVMPWLTAEFGVDDTKPFDVVRSCGRGANAAVIPWDLFREQHMRLAPDFPLVSVDSVRRTMYGNVCWADSACILANGDVTPCEMEFEEIQGNILRQSLTDVLLGVGGDNAQRLTKDKIEICKDCEYRYACWECRAMAHNLDGTRFSKPLTCMHNPYTGEWETPPSDLIVRFPKLLNSQER